MRQGQQLCFHGWAAQVENPFAEVSGSTRVYPALVHAELTPDSPNVQRTCDCPIPGNVQGWMGLGAAWGGGGRWQGWNWIGFKFLLSSQPNHAVIAIVAPSSFCWSHFEFAFLVASHHVLPWQSPSLETHCPGKTALIFYLLFLSAILYLLSGFLMFLQSLRWSGGGWGSEEGWSLLQHRALRRGDGNQRKEPQGSRGSSGSSRKGSLKQSSQGPCTWYAPVLLGLRGAVKAEQLLAVFNGAGLCVWQ